MALAHKLTQDFTEILHKKPRTKIQGFLCNIWLLYHNFLSINNIQTISKFLTNVFH